MILEPGGSLVRERTRTLLCVAAVALGVSMLLATNQIGGTLLEVLQQSETVQIYGHGLLFESFAAILDVVGIGLAAAWVGQLNTNTPRLGRIFMEYIDNIEQVPPSEFESLFWP